MMMNKYYVYLHINLSNDEVFYVGKGTGKRAYQKDERRSLFWNKVVNKYDYDIIIIEEGLTNNEAEELEKYYIKKFGRRDLGLGTLVNHTDGGGGMINYICSNETREKIRQTKIGLTHTPESKEKMRKSHKPLRLRLGVKHTDEAKSKIKEARKKQIFTEETREKMRLAQIKRRSDEKRNNPNTN